jgi:hypothetical protein
VEVRQLNADDESWDIVSPVEESRLIKRAKARFMSRLASSDAENEEGALSANVLRDAINENVAENSERCPAENSNHGIASLLDRVDDKPLEDVDQNATVSNYEAHSESS